MNYIVHGNSIEVLCKEFCPKDIFECGQVFCYKKIDDTYVCYPDDKLAVIYKKGEHYIIDCIKGNTTFFINFFDLDTDYSKIKKDIKFLINTNGFIFDKNLIGKAMEFGSGIRILKQNFLETLISFIFSANNNIKRITSSLDRLRERAGQKIQTVNSYNFYSFPKLDSLKKLSEKDFVEMGAGYRAKYLVDTISKFQDIEAIISEKVYTKEILNELLKLKGVGRKVADCILLFGLDKKDVFPVDTWIKKVYLDLSKDILSDGKNEIPANVISNILTQNFGQISGYIQQYLFFYKRELKTI